MPQTGLSSEQRKLADWIRYQRRPATRSLHIFDLDAGTVERLPSAGAAAIDFPGPHPLLEIIHCTVGAGGYWAIESDDPKFSYLAHTSSTISRIERVERDS